MAEQRAAGASTLENTLRHGSARWLPGALLVAIVAALGAWLAVEGLWLVKSSQR